MLKGSRCDHAIGNVQCPSSKAAAISSGMEISRMMHPFLADGFIKQEEHAWAATDARIRATRLLGSEGPDKEEPGTCLNGK
jgi:hypothetical protein